MKKTYDVPPTTATRPPRRSVATATRLAEMTARYNDLDELPVAWRTPDLFAEHIILRRWLARHEQLTESARAGRWQIMVDGEPLTPTMPAADVALWRRLLADQFPQAVIEARPAGEPVSTVSTP